MRIPSFNNGLSVANGMILTALLDVLIAKDVIDRGDVREILVGCLTTLDSQKAIITSQKDAAEFIRSSLLPHFTE